MKSLSVLVKKFTGLIEQYGTGTLETRLKSKDNRILDVLISCVPLNNDDISSGIVFTALDITKSKKTENELKSNENKLSSIFKVAPIGIGVVSNRVLMEVNEYICQILGYTQDELIGKSARILYPTDEEYEFVGREKYYQIEKSGIGTVETKWKRKDGKTIDVLLSSTPLNLKDISGGVTFIALDITERKRIEEELKVSFTKYQVLFESFPLGITISDKEGNIVESNKQAERLLGLPTEKHNERQIDSKEWKIIKPDQSSMAPDDFASVKALKENKLVENVQMGIVKENNNITWINVTASPIPLKDYGVAIAYGDISELKQREEELKHSEQMFRHIFNISPDAIFLLTKDGKFVDANLVAINRYGYTIDEFLTMTPVNLAPVRLRGDVLNIVKQAFDQELHFEWIHCKKSGEEFPVELHTKPLLIENKPNIFVEARDISERKKAEEEILQRKEELERFEKIVIGRELKMIELKERISELESKLKELE